MAVVATIIPLNKFRSIAKTLSTANTLIYETPAGVSSIILSAACSNKAVTETNVTVILQKPLSANTSADFTIVPSMTIPPNDVLSATSGRLVLEYSVDFSQGDKIIAYASANNAVDFIISMNEAANE